MSSSRDFIAATVADALLPALRRPVEDVIYETIDRRQIPTRTDFKEIRDLVNSLRGQLTGATGGVKRLAETVDELDERLATLEERVGALDDAPSRLAALERRLAALEDRPAGLSMDQLEERLAGLANLPRVAATPQAQGAVPADAVDEPPASAAGEEDEEDEALEADEADEADEAGAEGETCKVEGCTRAVRARGFCGRHYQKWRRGTLEGFEGPEAG